MYQTDNRGSHFINLIDGLWCLSPLSTIFQLYCDCQFYWLEETGVPGENHRKSEVTDKLLSHNLVSGTLRHDGFELTTLAVIGTDCTCSCKSNYHHTITAPKFTFLKSKCFKSCLKMKADTLYCVNIV
jgi:hypothetical protein